MENPNSSAPRELAKPSSRPCVNFNIVGRSPSSSQMFTEPATTHVETLLQRLANSSPCPIHNNFPEVQVILASIGVSTGCTILPFAFSVHVSVCLSFLIPLPPLSVQSLSHAELGSLSWRKNMGCSDATQDPNTGRALEPKMGEGKGGAASEPVSSGDTGRHFGVDNDKDQTQRRRDRNERDG